MQNVQKQQDRCTTFGWNPMGKIKTDWNFFLETYEYKFTLQYRIPCISMQGSYI
jgi:hypothetical protein